MYADNLYIITLNINIYVRGWYNVVLKKNHVCSKQLRQTLKHSLLTMESLQVVAIPKDHLLFKEVHRQYRQNCHCINSIVHIYFLLYFL